MAQAQKYRPLVVVLTSKAKLEQGRRGKRRNSFL